MKNIVTKLNRNLLLLAMFGKIIFIFSLGSILSLGLAKYSYQLLIISSILLVIYVNKTFIFYIKNKKSSFSLVSFGFLSALLLIFFLGIQSPQLPSKIPILVIGLMLILPSFIEYLKK